MTQILSPNSSVLVIGRILVYIDGDLQTAYDLAKQIQLAPLIIGQPSLHSDRIVDDSKNGTIPVPGQR